MSIHESGEDYLEAIYILGEGGKCVRSVEVAALLGVTKPSVSRAVSVLRTEDCLEMAADGALTLTPKGAALAARVWERHEVLTDFLTHLGVSRETAAADACRMEHVISEESFEKLRELAESQMGKRGKP